MASMNLTRKRARRNNLSYNLLHAMFQECKQKSHNHPQTKEIPHHLNQPNEKVLIPALRSNLHTFLATSLLHRSTIIQTEQIFRTRSRDTTHYPISNLTTNNKPDPFTKPPSTDLPIPVLKPLYLYQPSLATRPHTTNLFSVKP